MSTKVSIILLSILCSTLKIVAQEESIEVDGTKRTFHYTLPDNYLETKQYPLVIVFHGFNNEISSIGQYTKIDEKAKKAGFIAVYPHGTINENGYYMWNAGNIYKEWTKNAKDIEFIDALLMHMQTDYSIDNKRIYLVGYSNGSMMAYRVAALLADKIAAAACVAGQMVDTVVRPSQPVPIMHIHGDSDMAVPHTGITQYGFQMPAIDDVLRKWLDWNNCSTVPAVLKYSPELTALKWKGNADVQLYLLHGHGHDWPTEERGNWPATDYIWEFFTENVKK